MVDAPVMTKTYDMQNVSRGYDAVYKMVEVPCGEWVSVEDYQRLERENAEQREQLRTAIPAIATLKNTRDENEREIDRLRAALAKLRMGIYVNATDTVWAGPGETAVDFITHTLGDEWTAESSAVEPGDGPPMRTALELIRDNQIPQGMSPALFADRVLRVAQKSEG